MQKYAKISFVILALGVSACGDTVGEQALIGGDIVAGAAVGAAGNVLYCQQYPSRC